MATRGSTAERARPEQGTSGQVGKGGSGDARSGPRMPPGLRRWLRLAPRSRRLVSLVLGAVLLLVAAGAVMVYFTPLFDLRTVAVRVQHAPPDGDGELTPRQVRHAARPSTGTPLARVDTDAVRDRVASLRRTESVRVERDWPHTLRVRVTERRPVAVLRHGDDYVEVDRHGVRFTTVTHPPKSVPRIRMQASQPRSALFSDRELLRGAVRVAGDLPASVRKRARWVEVNSYDDIHVRLRGKSGASVVRWGSPKHGEAKAAVLRALLRHDDAAETYNVSSPGNPALG